MKPFILFLLSFPCIYGNLSLETYFSYMTELDQPRGNYQEGEIEIVIDPAEIARIQKIQENRLLKKGVSAWEASQFSQIGIVCEDSYWIWIRDAVYFPNKIPGTYDRLIHKNKLKLPTSGVAILPILPSGRIALTLNYRHATRSWELELPRGSIELGETVEEAARRELEEETGCKVSSLIFLGEVAPDTGVLSSVIPIFMGTVSSQGACLKEYSEAIADILSFSKEELQQGLLQGFLEVSIQGNKTRVPIRDGFLTFALLQAALRSLF